MPKGRPKKNGGGWPATDQNDRAAMDSWQDLLFNGGADKLGMPDGVEVDDMEDMYEIDTEHIGGEANMLAASNVQNLLRLYNNKEFTDEHPDFKRRIDTEIESLRTLYKMKKINEVVHDHLVGSIAKHPGNASLYMALDRMQGKILSIDKQIREQIAGFNKIITGYQMELNFSRDNDLGGDSSTAELDDGSVISRARDITLPSSSSAVLESPPRSLSREKLSSIWYPVIILLNPAICSRICLSMERILPCMRSSAMYRLAFPGCFAMEPTRWSCTTSFIFFILYSVRRDSISVSIRRLKSGCSSVNSLLLYNRRRFCTFDAANMLASPPICSVSISYISSMSSTSTPSGMPSLSAPPLNNRSCHESIAALSFWSVAGQPPPFFFGLPFGMLVVYSFNFI